MTELSVPIREMAKPVKTLNLYSPANCLIGELFHPIKLFLHFSGVGPKPQFLRRGECVRRCLMSRKILEHDGEVEWIITLKQPGGVRLAQAARKLAERERKKQ